MTEAVALRGGSPPEGDAAVWGVPAAIQLRWRQWDDDFVVHNVASGQTHRLNLLAGEALRCLEVEPASVKTLIDRLAALFAIPVDSEALGKVKELVDQLDELGLVAPVSP